MGVKLNVPIGRLIHKGSSEVLAHYPCIAITYLK